MGRGFTYVVPGDSGGLARVTVGLDELARGTGSSARDAVTEARPYTHIVVYLDRVASWEGHHLLDGGGVAPRMLVRVKHDVVHLRNTIFQCLVPATHLHCQHVIQLICQNQSTI